MQKHPRSNSQHNPSPLTPLERGKACLECRRMKQKCNGASPTCANCTRWNRPCRYETPVARGMTAVVLQERVDQLEAKLEALRSQSASRSGTSSSSSTTTVGRTTDGVHHAPKERIIVSTATPPEMSIGTWSDAESLPLNLRNFLITIFLENSFRIHFYFNQQRFIDRLASTSNPPHPCLLNAIYLLACYFTTLDHRPAYWLGEHEAVFLSRAQLALMDSLAMSDRLMDFIQASSLVAAYLIHRGRYLEGYHVHCGTARFALSCGMDRISKHDVSSLDMDPAPPYIQQPMLLAEPEDAVELGDRLLAFWHIYWHDKVFCILLGFLPALPHDDTIDSVFPREVEEYETGNVYLSRNETIAGFLARQGDEALLSQSSHRDSLFTTQLKAVTLLGRATRLTQKLRSRQIGLEEAAKTRKELHNITNSFLSSLPPIQSPQLPTNSPDELAVASAHAVASCALLELCDPSLVGSEPQAYSNRVTHASSIASSLLVFGDNFECQDAWIVTGYCWCLAGHVLAEHIRRVQSEGGSAENSSPAIGSLPGSSGSPSARANRPPSVTECEVLLSRLLSALNVASNAQQPLAHHVQRLYQSLGDLKSE